MQRFVDVAPLLPWADAQVTVGNATYEMNSNGIMLEKKAGRESKYTVLYAIGGKNVYYFLTPMAKGRLQVLPIGFDVRKKEWFDVVESGVRHFEPSAASDAASRLHWQDAAYTFNTSCYHCHVSQLNKNYNRKTNSYRTEWKEPGINCETCHGPSARHIEVCEAAAKKNEAPKDLEIIRGGSDFSHQQNNDACAVCHARLIPLTDTFSPGDNFFDHFDLVVLETPDFYPDGRELGETYSYTTFLRSGCAISGQLDCTYCHTSSGRFRFKDNPNKSCAPCHDRYVNNLAAHSHHPAGAKSPGCIHCHMPITEFARMKRSDHSMKPPVPAATLAFGSPNACNLCHLDKTAAWADKQVTRWHGDVRKKAVLHIGNLIAEARAQNWVHLKEILTLLERPDTDEITKATLFRLLSLCTSEDVEPYILKGLQSSSPLVRASAILASRGSSRPQLIKALLPFTRDKRRLVRVRAAQVLATVDTNALQSADRKALEGATEEYLKSLMVQEDNAFAYQDLGNFYLDRQQFSDAINTFEHAIALRPDVAQLWNNLALAQYATRNASAAKESFERALSLAPEMEATHLNLAMLMAEQKDMAGARQHFTAALKANPHSAQAAYNLCILDAVQRWAVARPLCARAAANAPDNPDYSYAYAFYLQQHGESDSARQVLSTAMVRFPSHRGISGLYARLTGEQGATGGPVSPAQ